MSMRSIFESIDPIINDPISIPNTDSKFIISEANFKGSEFKDILEGVVAKLYEGLNELNIAENYLRKSGQGGTLSSFKNKHTIPLQSVIDNLENFIDNN